MIIGQISGCALILSRLLGMQVFSKSKYVHMSNQNQFRPEFITPKRGKILDTNNLPLACDKMQYNLIIHQTSFKQIDVIIAKLIPLLHKDRRPKNIKSFLQKIRIKIRQNPSSNLIIWRSLQKEEILRIEYIKQQLPEVEIRQQKNRVYPFNKAISSIVGYLRHNISLQKIQKNKMMLKLINQEYKEGQMGIEKTMNLQLAGKLGLEIVKVDAFGSIISKNIHTHPTSGKDVKLTIDAKLQQIAFDNLGERAGTVCLIDLLSGGILVAASTPSFDPLMFNSDINLNNWNNAQKEKSSFSNRNFTIPYSPGSVFKVVSALDALQNGVDPNDTFTCVGQFRFGTRIFHCNRASGHGKVNLTQAIARSCNCYFYNLGASANVDNICNTATMLGLNKHYNIGGMQTNKGIIPSREWKKNRFGTKWIPGETINTVIGQGYTECTPLQLAVMAASLASGNSIEPTIIKTDVIAQKPMLVNPEYLSIIQNAMRQTFTDKEGTCRFFNNAKQSYQMAGKTGTAQVISTRIKLKDILANKIDKQKIAHGVFVGYAPYEQPRFAISTVLEHGRSGSACIPIAKKVIMAAINKLRNIQVACSL